MAMLRLLRNVQRNVQESLNIPDCPFSEKRLSGLPGGMTRMGAGIIKGKLDGHATSSDSAPGCSPACRS